MPGQTGREREWNQHWHYSQVAEDRREGRIFGGAVMDRDILLEILKELKIIRVHLEKLTGEKLKAGKRFDF